MIYRVKKYWLVLIFLAVHLFFLVNLQFTAWPEMLSYAYLRNHGFLIYKDMIHPYPPLLTMGLSWVYALFGYQLWVLQAVAWTVILASGILVFLITREITKSDKLALISLGGYVFLQPFLEGNMLWFDLAIIPPILLGLLFLLKKNLFLAGLFLGIAMLTKQTAGLYLIFSILYLVFIGKARFGELKKIFYGPLILGIPFFIKLIQERALMDFINWVLVYPLTKWGSIIGYVRMELSAREWLTIIILFAPLIYLVFNRQVFRDKAFQLLLIFLAGSLVAVYPRFSFFHFQPALALLLIVYGYLFTNTKFNPLPFSFYLLVFTFVIQQPVLARDWQKGPRFYTQEDLEMAQIITRNIGESERVYLLGLHSGLYAMADRLPPERWTDNFAWYLEIPGVQEEVISRWENPPAGGPPKYIFWRTPSVGNPFDLGTYQPAKITEWLRMNYYQKEEVKPGIKLWTRN